MKGRGTVTRVSTLFETGYPTIVSVLFVFELNAKVITRTGEREDGTVHFLSVRSGDQGPLPT